jgi:hypothetical protein
VVTGGVEGVVAGVLCANAGAAQSCRANPAQISRFMAISSRELNHDQKSRANRKEFPAPPINF